MSDPTMADRLSEIKRAATLARGPTDILWLVARVEALEIELAYLRDHPGWVAPQAGSEK